MPHFCFIARRFSARQKVTFLPVECVGATIGRPPAWRSSAFPGKAFSQPNGHGRAMLAPTKVFDSLKGAPRMLKLSASGVALQKN
jgi:hypothetical protein